MKTAVELVINEIDKQQKRYIDLAKKDKSIKKEVDAILTATTFLKMRCEQALEMEKQQIIDACNQTEFEDIDGMGIHETITKGEEYYNHKFKNK